ncbi:hypothetical protein JW758_00030 [Candidatus Peregrinibacteria bacterium]|nr:hypothetical protein [Candidatus Peregrinibacteria bacterium]
MNKLLSVFAISMLLLSACVTTSVNLGDDREYFSQDKEVCERIDFVCDEGTEMFSDTTGCGCEKIEGEDVEEVAEEEVVEESDVEEGVEDEVVEDVEDVEDEEAVEEVAEEELEEIEGGEGEGEGEGEAELPDLVIVDDLVVEPLIPTVDPAPSIVDDMMIDLGDIEPMVVPEVVVPIPAPDPAPGM